MAHFHIHTLPDGTETGLPVTDTTNVDKHFHIVEGDATSSDAFGVGHTHTIHGEITSPPIDRDSNKGDKMNKETKHVGGNVVEVKQIERNGVPIGQISGYIATWDLDRGSWGLKDQFVKGAFAESILEHQAKNRQVRFKDHHDRTVGGFPPETLREDETGLFGTAEVNLEVQRGREVFSLAKQGVLTDFSVGFTSLRDSESGADGDRVRTISKATLWEGSIVDEPMNPKAKVTEVKTVAPFQDLPLASQDRPWDSKAAIERVKEFTDSAGEPSSKYCRAFTWSDKAKSDEFSAYRLPFADVINGKLTAVPKGIFAAAKALQDAQGSADLPEALRPAAIRHIEKYYAKMGLDSPFGEGEKQYFVADDVKAWTEREVEKFLKETGRMSKSAAKTLAGRLDIQPKELDNEDQSDITELLSELKSFKESLAK